MDPTALVMLSAAVGGATGKFVEKAWDSGQKWLDTYFANHREKAQETARANSAEFLSDLAKRIKQVEESNPELRQQIQDAQDQPDFSVLLHKALIAAAQTDNRGKHELLARLVSERLMSGSESLLTLISKVATDAISDMNDKQLRILGLQSTLYYVRPNGVAAQVYQGAFLAWALQRLSPYQSLQFTQLDLLHLDSLSCLRYETTITRDLKTVLTSGAPEGFVLDFDAFVATPIGSHVFTLWQESRLNSVTLTAAGMLIGIYVSDSLLGITTSLAGLA